MHITHNNGIVSVTFTETQNTKNELNLKYYMCSYVIYNNGSYNNLPCYHPDSH